MHIALEMSYAAHPFQPSLCLVNLWKVLFSFFSIQPHMQITIIAFLCHPSLCCMPCLRVLLSTFFISLTVPFFPCSSFEYFPVLSYFTKSPCSLSCIQRAHQITSCQFPRHVVSLPHHQEPVSTPV